MIINHYVYKFFYIKEGQNMKFLSIFILSVSMAIISQTGVEAAKSEWMGMKKIKVFMHNLDKQGMLPTSFVCRENSKKPSSPLVQVTYKKNTSNTRWVWAWGSRYAAWNGQLKSKGYKKVSDSKAKGYFGYYDRCALWHLRPENS